MDRTIRLLMLAALVGACVAGNGYNYARPARTSGSQQPIVTKSVYYFADPGSQQNVQRQRPVAYRQAAVRQRTAAVYRPAAPQQPRVTYTQAAPQQPRVSYTPAVSQQVAPQQQSSYKIDPNSLPFYNSNKQYAQQQVKYSAPQAAPQQVQYTAPKVVQQQVQYTAPQVIPQQVQYTAPQQVQYTAPQQVQYSAPQAAPQQVQYSAPQQVQYTAPQQVQYSAPQQVQYTAPQQVQYSAPQQVQYTAPQQVQYSAPQVAPQQVQYAAPQQPQYTQPQPAPVVKKNLQVVFVRTPGYEAYTEALLKMAKEAIQSQTIVYVLSKEPDVEELTRRFKEIQSTARKMPEVRFIKYKTNDEAVQAQQEIQAQYESLPGPSSSFGTQIGTVIGGASSETGSTNSNYSNNDAITATLPLTATTITGPATNVDDVNSQSFPPFVPTGIDVVPGSSYLPPNQQ